MRREALTKLKYISLVVVILLAGYNIVLIFSARETSAQVGTSPYTGSVIYVQPLGDIEPEKTAVVREILEDNFNRKIVFLPSKGLKRSHYVRSRGQYEASKLMSWAAGQMPQDTFRYIALLDEDIFTGRYNYIFGQAQMPGKLSIVSLARFVEPNRDIQPPERPLFKRRITNLLLHELGHTLGLAHCRHEKCVMHFANSVIELDNQSVHYCPECLEKLRWAGIIDIFIEDSEALRYLQTSRVTGDNNGTIR